MSTTYPATITDNTGRIWSWSEAWGGYRSEGMTTHGYDTIRDQWGIASPEVGREYTLGGGSTVYTVASVNENMAMLTWTKPGDIGIRNRYLAAVEFGRLVPVDESKPYVARNGNRFTADQARLITEPLRYDPELAERAAIQADAENERDGYRG